MYVFFFGNPFRKLINEMREVRINRLDYIVNCECDDFFWQKYLSITTQRSEKNIY